MAAHTLGSRPRTGDVLLDPGETSDFSSLLLSQPVLEGLEAAGFNRPSPIQSKAIPLGRCGLDLIVQAKSGTGKTCVFSTVALDSLILQNTATQILVLAPTREIAVQIHSVITSIGSRMEGLECHVFIGGTPLPQDKARLKKCHIAVGSPGRIKQLIEIGFLNTASIRLFILDEADKLLEEGSFQEQINWIYSSLPANKQMLAVSATYPESLAKALTRYMREPTFVRLNVSDPSLLGLKQYYKVVNSYPLPHKIFEEKVTHLQELFSKIPFNQALVFSNLHSRAQHLAEVLTTKGFPAVCISGSMNQNQRLEAMAKLKLFHCRVLISTDLTSRGIDAEKVNLVINLDVPHDWETYMHRIGRAGRFGTYGLSVTYCCRGEEENLLMGIAQKCNLHLLPLPDPIPEGLMGKACNWDVEVKAMKVTSQDFSSEIKDTGTRKPPVIRGNSLPEIPSHKDPPKTNHTKLKKVVKKKTIEKGSPPEQEQFKGVDFPTEEKIDTKMKRTGEKLEEKIKENRDDLKSLPKIPSLASFKRPVVCTSSFAELVEDYEQFIKEGLEKHVEIIRVYTGPGESAEDHGKDKNDEAKLSDAFNSPENHDLSEISESDRSSSSSSSESEECYKDSDQTQEKIRSVDLLSTCPVVSAEKTAKTVCKSNRKILPPSEIQEGSLVKTHSYTEEGDDFSNAQKSKRRNKRATHISRREICPDRSDELYQLDYRSPGAFPYGPVSYADYWRSYYQAWQTYNSAVSSSYYRNIYKRSNWMSAYHMHAVYLHEMLKP
ncbi:probable ATP-dependent RNA helicase DDX20 [Spea bombifrons]|uniref:probable ATP-dependent RNA helicase DDX20 n=1 Tax=Spea bombifrons TaxID=233779 RepID=UPI00234A80A9|nr:probable ATP-dependent RNA helicase DDX20 [Spea bombifrons]